MSVNLARGYSSRKERLPQLLHEIDASWLTQTLRNKYPAISVDSMSVVQHIPGHTSKLRVSIEASGDGARDIPTALCIKGNFTGDPLSGPANVNEARFYRDLAAHLILPSPPCIYSDWDDDDQGHQGVMILEDLIPLGGRFGSSAEPISAGEAMRGLEALALLHGSTWGDARLDNSSWLFTSMAPDNPVDDYWMLMGPYIHQVNAMPERMAAFPRWISEDTSKLRKAWLQLAEYDLSQPGPRCLVHGDAHLGNSYALPDGRRLFLDWQIVRRGRPWRDYTYWVAGSLPKEERRHSERDLLARYLKALAGHGVTISFDEAWDEYRRWLIWGLVAWHLNTNPNENTMATLSRFIAAADDHHVEQFFRL
jgi:hypothetical protein